MENKGRRGRPAKTEKVVRRDHFSVWVTKEEKQKIIEIIGKSGLSASQFFVTLALNSPWKRPRRRELPAKTAETIRILEQLSGILSLAVLKTKDHQMLSQQWQQSSQRVRLIADLISLWLFEEFEIRTLQKTMEEMVSFSSKISFYLQNILNETESKNQILIKLSTLKVKCCEVLKKHQGYYQTGQMQSQTKVWASQLGNPEVVHQSIQDALTKIIKRIEHDW